MVGFQSAVVLSTPTTRRARVSTTSKSQLFSGPGITPVLTRSHSCSPSLFVVSRVRAKERLPLPQTRASAAPSSQCLSVHADSLEVKKLEAGKKFRP